MLQTKYNYIAILILLELSSSPSGATSLTLDGSQNLCTTTFLKLHFIEHNVGVEKKNKIHCYCEFCREADLARGRAQVAPRGDGECSFCGLWPHLPSTYQCTAWRALEKGKVAVESPADGVQNQVA